MTATKLDGRGCNTPPDAVYQRGQKRGKLNSTKSPLEAMHPMSDLKEDLASFHRYAGMKLEASGYESLEELLGLWRANHPLPKKSAAAPTERSKSPKAKNPDPPGKSAVPYL